MDCHKEGLYLYSRITENMLTPISIQTVHTRKTPEILRDLQYQWRKFHGGKLYKCE